MAIIDSGYSQSTPCHPDEGGICNVQKIPDHKYRDPSFVGMTG